jgi:hypothetical protein
MRANGIIVTAGLAAALAAGLAVSAAIAGPEHLATIEGECGRQLRMPAQSCKCMRDRAAMLKDGQQAFVAAVVVKDKAAQAQVRQKLTIEELTEAGMFMTNVRSHCSRQ